ncbi:MAG TPA: PKD domain-containing protein, partial [Bacteroidia bacterium]|nr:PKD domain-containing protein [Bacteroidia bacterium]
YTIDTKNSNRIWLGSTGYTAGNKIYYSSNAGQSWTNISGTFPNMPILCMEYLPGSNDGIYVGTEVGLFYKDASMSDWIYYDQGLPNVRIDDIDFDMVNGKIRVATYGRGIWESPLHPDANAKPVAEFDYSTKSGCKGLTLTFNAGGSFNATSWNWNFQGGTPSTSTSKNPTVTYNTSGTFSVSLTASNVNGSSTFSKPGVVVISTDEVNNNYPYTQNFDNLITGDEVNLGGWINGTDDERNWRVHSGSAPGAVGPSGDHTSGNGKYLLFQPTGTGYWGNLYSPCLNLSSLSNPVFEYYVYVDDLKNMDPLYLDVQVDGKLQTDVFPAVEKIGNFWLKKTVDLTPYANKTIQLRFRAKSAHTDRAYAIDDIKIYSRPNAAPVADFIANPTYDVVGFTAKFYDQSSNLPTAYSWSFPGGTPSTSTAANPEITYSTSGQYNVSLTATNAYGSHTATKSSYITVNGTEYNMSNRTVTDCVGRLFDSGGQNGDYGNNENFTFTIAPSGTELVKLTFESWGLSDGDALSIYDGTSTSAPLIGSYGGFFIPNEIVATSGKVTLKFSSNETGTRSGFAISWQAKGGNTCSPGTTIPAPIADFNSTITGTTAPYSVELIDNSQNNPMGWTWLLPGADFERVYSRNVTAFYNTPGTYTITLIVVNEGGRNTISKTITITAPPVEINMKNGTETSCNGTLYDDGGATGNYLNSKAYTLVIQPAGATSVTINFSQWAVENNYDFLRIYNGTSTSAPQLGNGWSGTSPGTVTANSGAMTLRFTSDANTTAAGWKATWSATGGTCGGTTPAPVANFTASATTITAGSSVNFTDLSTNTPTSWSWSFQGGTPATSTVKNPTVSYSVAGTYSVALTATNAGGSNTKSVNGYITVTTGGGVTINMKNGTETSCNGTLYDDGGATGNYLNSKAYTLVIQPAGATSVTINFSQWAVENNYDFLRIYNGTSTSAPQLGNGWSGTSPGTVTANSGAMTLRFTSDGYVNAAGWKATWSCTNSFTEGDAVRILYEENDFIVYPNPTAGEFTVTMNKKYEQLTISDITGSTLLSIPVQGNQMKVQLPDFKAGLYFIQLHSGSEIKTQKLIVQ